MNDQRYRLHLAIVREAMKHGWRIIDGSPRYAKSEPTLVLVKSAVIFVFLLTNSGRPTKQQREWNDALNDAFEPSYGCHECGGADRSVLVAHWRPRDWNEIVATLKSDDARRGGGTA